MNVGNSKIYVIFALSKIQKRTMAKKSTLEKVKKTATDIAIGGIQGLILAYVLFIFLPALGLPRGVLGTIISIAAFVICFILQVIIHELGHLVAGKMSGYKLLWLGIFNTTFVKKGRKLMRMKVNIEGVLGHCLMSPPEMKNGKYPFVLYFLGGSLMNFLVSAISLALFLIFFPNYWILAMFAGVGLVLGIFCIVPMKAGNITNDGYDILKHYKNDAERHNFWHLCRFYEDLIVNDMRFRDISEEQFALFDNKSQNNENQSNALNAVAEIFRLNWLFDRREFEKAKALIESLLNTSDDTIGLLKNEFICALLLLELIDECRKEEVERLYTKELNGYIKATSSQAARQLLLYAYAKLFLQDDAQATEALEKFNQAALSNPFSGD